MKVFSINGNNNEKCNTYNVLSFDEKHENPKSFTLPKTTSTAKKNLPHMRRRNDLTKFIKIMAVYCSFDNRKKFEK